MVANNATDATEPIAMPLFKIKEEYLGMKFFLRICQTGFAKLDLRHPQHVLPYE